MSLVYSSISHLHMYNTLYMRELLLPETIESVISAEWNESIYILSMYVSRVYIYVYHSLCERAAASRDYRSSH